METDNPNWYGWYENKHRIRICIKQNGETWASRGQVFGQNGIHAQWLAAENPVISSEGLNSLGQYCYRCATIRQQQSGCFVPETLISMADGSQRKIEDLSSGELVVSGKTGAPIAIKSILESNEKEPIIAVTLGERAVRVTQTHPFSTARGYVVANELRVGDQVVEPDGSFSEITEIKELPIDPAQRVINVTLDTPSKEYDDHLLVADGIVTGDLYVQKAMAAAKEEQ